LGKEKPEQIPFEGLTAEFIGTDYDFAFSSVLRKTIFKNCLEKDRDLYMKFKEYKPLPIEIRAALRNEPILDEDFDPIVYRHIH
jgi:hypothetical protein